MKLATRGEIEYPPIAVNGEGAGWATWTDDHSPSHVSALPIVPRPKVTRAGAVSLQTPRECVAIGGSFPVSLGVSGTVQLASVRFSVPGGKAKTITRSPYRATLALKAAPKTVVVAQLRLPSMRGHTRLTSIRTAREALLDRSDAQSGDNHLVPLTIGPTPIPSAAARDADHLRTAGTRTG